MSFQNGISNLQQLFTQVAPSGTAGASAANRAAQAQAGAAAPALLHATAAGQGVDQASLSSTGGLAAQASQTPDVRMERIAPLQQAIAAGTYNVSSADVAEKMMGSLLGRGLPPSTSNG
ncbi:MAG: flagellar biosynthesis anti-sigma factor FlgM [Acidobacteriaceae bacterium]